MVEQFCYVTPLTALLGAALDREQNYQKHLHAAQGAVQVMRLASMFICLQAEKTIWNPYRNAPLNGGEA